MTFSREKLTCLWCFQNWATSSWHQKVRNVCMVIWFTLAFPFKINNFPVKKQKLFPNLGFVLVKVEDAQFWTLRNWAGFLCLKQSNRDHQMLEKPHNLFSNFRIGSCWIPRKSFQVGVLSCKCLFCIIWIFFCWFTDSPWCTIKCTYCKYVHS